VSNFRFFSIVCSLAVVVLSCKQQDQPSLLFKKVSVDKSQLNFRNDLKEDESFNIIEYLYLYNGGGVALGDINNDGLIDVYLTSNQDSNRLYLNKGNWVFEDITRSAKTWGEGNWKTGVSMADVNGDGWLDIFLCGVGNYKKFKGRNQLLLNNRDQTFTDVTDQSGLSFSGFSTQAAFFDYDLDGDLDMYLTNHSVHSPLSYGKASNRLKSDSLAGDRLYRNDINITGKLHFVDVTKAAGIYNSSIGYGLSVGLSDLNTDGYPDIYISNDFSENDYLYINNRNGSFRELSQQAFKHTSRFSMGNDIADLNNDGLPDIVTLDMRPYKESVIKTSASEDAYEIWKFKESYGFLPQVSRNAIQINQGLLDSGRLVFTDLAQMSSIAATDWSWGPLSFDADGDGNKDIFITNGIVRRPNNMDYIAFISSDSSQNLMKQGTLPWVKLMPEGSETNFFFKGLGDNTFHDMTKSWADFSNDFSTGAAYADLDNDGDPDLVVNRVNDYALLLENQAKQSFLSIQLKGPAGNNFGVGTKIKITQAGRSQFQELFPTRGWQSCGSYRLMFGVLPNQPIEIVATWPNGNISRKVTSSKAVLMSYDSSFVAKHDTSFVKPILAQSNAINYVHHEDQFTPFSREPLIPFSWANMGPCIAVSEDKNDVAEFIFVGSSVHNPAKLYKENSKGGWTESADIDQGATTSEDTDAQFFDFDGDGDNDLLVVAGGGEKMNDKSLVPRLYQNVNGRLKLTKGLFPEISLNASCARPNDFDGDGDIDVFIGGAVMPFLYGMPPPSYLVENVGGRFIINQVWSMNAKFNSPSPNRPGMISDAVWADVNRDKRPDLILVGQWMPITVLIQRDDHRFENQTETRGLKNSFGLWNSIETHDLDQDGDLDFVVGNLGLNSRLKASQSQPLELYVGDFDSNGGSDQILVYYNEGKQHPFITRDQLVKQIPSFKRKFLRYEDFKNAKLQDIITPIQQGNAALLKASTLYSAILLQDKDSLRIQPLPSQAQYSSVYATLVTDVNSDQLPDIILVGNQTEVQPEIGPFDASIGLVLLGDGKGNFSSLSPQKSGFYVPGNSREIRLVKTSKNNSILVGRNNNSVLSFTINPNP
jgi:enediyne biosynthesis protein E4